MNGQGFGALVDGMMGGYKAGKSFEGMKSKIEPAKKADGSTQESYSGDLSKFQATPDGSVGAEGAAPAEKADSWGNLAGIFDGAVESSRSIPVVGDMLGKSPAGGLLSGGMGNTIFGKLTGGKGLGGTLLGGLMGK
jgi:hypothetical protein